MDDTFSQITAAIDALPARQSTVIVAIDGRCAAGKTTLAGRLSRHYACNIFHMDDFFLRPEQRTLLRYGEIGGNVDYERFREEILLPLRAQLPFSYRPFDCTTFTLSAPVAVTPKRLNIIEGTYSLHPYFLDIQDLKVFLTVSPEEQRRRILNRPPFLHDRFFREWIPMEERYFSGFGIREKSDLIL